MLFRSPLFRIFLFFVFLASCVASAAVAGDAVWRDKVAAPALEAAAAGPTQFLVYLDQQADLSQAAAIADPDQRARYVHETLVEFASANQAPLLAALDAAGVGYRPFWIANLVLVDGDESVLELLASRSDVARVHANPRIEFAAPAVEPDDAKAVAGVEWGVESVGAPTVWAHGITGEGTVVGGIDTGYEWEHPAIIDQYRGWDGVEADHDYNWHDAVHSGGGVCGPDSPEPCDDHGHGTHTMGTMVGDDGLGNQIGMAPGARWIGCRCMNEGDGTPAMYIECLEWMVAPYPVGGSPSQGDPAKAPQVINNSWVCPESEGCSWDTLQPVIENVRAAGIVVVASAGNEGSDCSTVADPPAIYAAAFSVGATDESNEIAPFSSRGPVDVDASMRMKPDISAPGVAVRSCYPGDRYVYMSGTSMAGPHVAGLVALMVSANPALAGNVDIIEEIIEGSASPMQSDQCGDVTAVPNNVFGYGGINAAAAFSSSLVGIQGPPVPRGARARLLPNVPNPFNPRTTICFELGSPAAIDLRIFDVSGGLVRVLAEGPVMAAGGHEIVWDGCDGSGRVAAAGVYFCRLDAGGSVSTLRMALVK